VNLLGAAAIAGTYYFQYQNRPSILNLTPGISFPGISFVGLPDTATQVFSTRGNIQVGQIRLVLGPENSSARFPVSITYSNRTEFIDRPGWRGQVGVSYDFDSLSGNSAVLRGRIPYPTPPPRACGVGYGIRPRC
jgi:hypothetical protein